MTIMLNIWLYYGLWILSIVGLIAIAMLVFIFWHLRNLDCRISW